MQTAKLLPTDRILGSPVTEFLCWWTDVIGKMRHRHVEEPGTFVSAVGASACLREDSTTTWISGFVFRLGRSWCLNYEFYAVVVLPISLGGASVCAVGKLL